MNLFSKRPYKNVLRFWAMILTGAILMTSLSGCMGEKLLPTELSFSQVEYERPDGQGVLDLIDKAKEQAENDILPFGMIWTLRKIGDATQEFYSMMTIAQIRNYLDVNDTFYSEEMEYLDTFDARIQNSYNQMFSSIENFRFSSIQNMIFGESGAEDLQMSSQASSEEILSLQEQEKKLVAEYYYEYAQATVSTPEGEVLFSSLDSEGQSAYYNQFIQKYNQQFGELYLELVSLREQMAQALGYDSYTQVADLDMLRNSYTREDIKTFREDIKQTIAPVYRSYLEDFYRRAENRDQPGYVYLLGEQSPVPQGSWQETLDQFEQLYQQMSEQTGECYSYLLSHEFIDAEPSQTKANVTFSTLIYSLNTPFLFANMNGSAEDVFSISHEFGHCFAMWQQLKLGSQQEGRSMDVSEIHSQAMQMLTLPYYEIFYGEDAGTARKYDVYTMVAGILTAAMNDEFQEKIYENPQMTVQELNELYKELAMEYGLVVESPYFDMESFSMGWFTTNQYFDTPFYAIDYALSGCVAMEFLQMGLEDYTQALETYLSLVQQNSDYDFMTVLEETGLSSPFETEQMEALAQTMEDFLQGDGSFSADNTEQESLQDAA